MAPDLSLTLIFTVFLHWIPSCHGQNSMVVTSLRLVNDVGNAVNKGRVVVQLNHIPVNGSICGYGFDDKDARVVCRMLGLTGGRAILDGSYGTGNKNFLLSGLQCVGTEPTLTVCAQETVIRCSYQSPEVGVECDPSLSNTNPLFDIPGAGPLPLSSQVFKQYPPKIYYGNVPEARARIRLRGVEGADGMGYVEVFNNLTQTWGFVCDDEWSELDARAVCLEMNYTLTTTEICCPRPGILVMYQSTITGSASIALDDVRCTGSESSIFDCPHSPWGSHNCKGLTNPGDSGGTTEFAGVQCLRIPETKVDIPDPNVTCNSDSIVVIFACTVQNCETIKRFYVGTMAGCDKAKITCDNTHIYITIPLNACGTNLLSNCTHNIYQNQVIYVYQVGYLGIVTNTKSFLYTVQCVAPMAVSTNIIGYQPSISYQNKSVEIEFKYEVRIDFYLDWNCSVLVTQNPYVVEMSSWVYLGVKLVTSDPVMAGTILRLVLTNCKANAVGDPSMTSAFPVDLISKKCSKSQSVSMYPINNTLESFRFQAFQFQGYSQVYIKCDVLICLANDTSPECDRSCNTGKISQTIRRKRAASGQLMETTPIYMEISKAQALNPGHAPLGVAETLTIDLSEALRDKNNLGDSSTRPSTPVAVLALSAVGVLYCCW
ncbi:uncharacterized protein LOC131955291 [Physella acuta]|uniref:uncharacterized protein LOC131955291 n=1 Tax=Physella acuta TaxID=109671 RepID=UPI0027DE8867|nr:uncharacterized protein LOC131955291 [Physella acuta]